MNELQRRDIAPPTEAEKFMDGLKTLLETFGGSDSTTNYRKAFTLSLKISELLDQFNGRFQVISRINV